MLDMPRRISTYTVASGLASLNLTATIGAYIFGPAAALAVLNLILSLRKPPVSGPNPWEAREMEWTGDYTGSLTGGASTGTVGSMVAPGGNTRSSRWYWCGTGSCQPTEKSIGSSGKPDILRKVEVES